MRDPTPFQPAEEFTYLVDLNKATERMEQEVQAIEEGTEGSVGKEEYDVAMAALGLPGLKQESVMAEANASMIHARGEYSLAETEDSFLKGLSEAGATEVLLPAHFPQGRWMGHLFLARPGDLMALLMRSVDKSLAEVSERMAEEGAPVQFSLDTDTWARLYGLDSAAQAHDWMGDELIVFSLSNPDFDPSAPGDYSNMPSYSLLAISTERSEDGLGVFETLLDSTFTLFGMTDMLERTTLDEHPALLVHTPTFEGSPIGEMVTEEQREQLAEIPPALVVAMPGYLFLGDRPSVEAALEVYKEKGSGTGRNATVECELNWDLLLEAFLPSNPGVYLSMLKESSPAGVGELLDRLYEATRDTAELGTSRATVLVQDGESFHLDVYTSRESIGLLEKIQRVIEETPQETWEELGRQLGQAISQGAMGGAGGQEFEFEFEK
jgi:hypothetical protein